jgi:hypothetical protein
VLKLRSFQLRYRELARYLHQLNQLQWVVDHGDTNSDLG